MLTDLPMGIFDGFVSMDATQKADAILYATRRFPDLHCLATWFAAGKKRTDAEISPQYACECAPCSTEEAAAQQAGIESFKQQAAAVQAYPKGEVYFECEDQDFWCVEEHTVGTPPCAQTSTH